MYICHCCGASIPKNTGVSKFFDVTDAWEHHRAEIQKNVKVHSSAMKSWTKKSIKCAGNLTPENAQPVLKATGNSC